MEPLIMRFARIILRALLFLPLVVACIGGSPPGHPKPPLASPANKPTPEPAPEPGFAKAENSGSDCPMPELASPGQLPNIAGLPDPFLSISGERISSREDWRCHRQETNWQFQFYETGVKPPKPASVSGSVNQEAIVVQVKHQGNSIKFTANVTIPSVGQAPYPAMIGVGGSYLDNAYLAGQGVALINFNNNEIGAQSGPDSRGTGLFYDLYGSDHSASSMTAWAWGVSRVIDVLDDSQRSLIDPTRLGITGCSRNGKGALLAGALDERIALTIPQESGAGGTVAWRVAQSLANEGVNVQTLSSAAGEQPWFRESFGRNFGGSNVTRLPFDHHQLMGMVAPRGLLVIDNTIDWLGPQASYIATMAAREIYRALGVPENIGYSENGGNPHCQLPDYQREVMGTFVQRFLLGQPGNTDIMRSTQNGGIDINAWIDWSTPTLD